GRRVPDDHRVDAHRLDVLGRVDERLALGRTGTARREVHDIRPEPPGGQPEAHPGAGGRLVEQVDDDLALQVVALRRVPDADPGEPLRRVQQAGEFGRG